MSTFALNIAIIFILLLSSTTIKQCMCNNHNVVRCNEKDRGALLIFKQGIIDPSELLSTWSTEKDCCAWKGIHCDNITSRVTEIDFGPSVFSEDDQFLGGEISFSILQLEFLNYLDLSINKFDSISIPPSFHNFTHSSNLYYLDISQNRRISMDNLHWLSPLSSLKYLNLSGIDLHKETNWLQAVAMLPSLLELQLYSCDLNNFMINPSFGYENFTSLTHLDLSANNFSSKLPKQLFNLTKDLTYIDLSFSNIYGEIPSSLLNLRNLSHLDLSGNQLQRSNLDWIIGQLEHLQVLGLCLNRLSGSIPSTIGNLSSLVALCIGLNNLSGEISEITFSRLSKLEFLDMRNLSCTFQFDHEWVPPFQLNYLYLANTNQGPKFPSWIYTQKLLKLLDLSSSGISFIDENKFWSFVKEISHLRLSNNSISGDISNVTLNSYYLTLDHNNFIGAPPHLSPMVKQVDLSHNFFSGSIPHSWKNLKDLEYINLWNNRLSGQVLVHLSHSEALEFLNLEKNEFSGTIPINMSQNLRVIILRGNQFEGTIPPQLFNMSSLFHLDLADNKFSGNLPECVYNITNMITRDVILYVNSKIDLFTKGQAYLYPVDSQRRTIDLSVNKFTGEVPLQLFRLIQVQTLNLSHNNFTGTIPNIIGGMKNMESLDLSNNGFSGEIPQSMALLNFLSYLNLSCNDFTGRIPTGTQLQSFDRSSYIENPELCGAPLKNCTREEENPTNAKPSRENEGDDPFKESVYLGMGVGFAAGFWGICGSLFLIKKWRNACYQFFERVFDQVYVTLMIKFKSFRNNSASAS